MHDSTFLCTESQKKIAEKSGYQKTEFRVVKLDSIQSLRSGTGEEKRDNFTVSYFCFQSPVKKSRLKREWSKQNMFPPVCFHFFLYTSWMHISGRACPAEVKSKTEYSKRSFCSVYTLYGGQAPVFSLFTAQYPPAPPAGPEDCRTRDGNSLAASFFEAVSGACSTAFLQTPLVL